MKNSRGLFYSILILDLLANIVRSSVWIAIDDGKWSNYTKLMIKNMSGSRIDFNLIENLKLSPKVVLLTYKTKLVTKNVVGFDFRGQLDSLKGA